MPYPYPQSCLSLLKEGGWNFNCKHLPEGALNYKLTYLDSWLKLMQSKFSIIYLVAEQPTFHHSEKGRIAARQGYTINLGTLLGFIIARLDCVNHHSLIPPAQWKGMVPKHATFKKFQRTFHDSANWNWHDSDHDIIDAIMLLHYWLTQKHNVTI